MTRPRSAATLTDSVVREPSCAVVREQPPPSREASFKTQGKWVSMQQTALRHRRQRCAHLLSLLERELADDEKREIALYGFADADPQRKKHIAQHYKMRAEGADRVMRVLEARRRPPVVARTRVRHGRSGRSVPRSAVWRRRRDRDDVVQRVVVSSDDRVFWRGWRIIDIESLE